MKRSNTFFILGLLLLIVGAAFLVYGIIEYNRISASFGNALGKLFTGKSAEEDRAIFEMIGGGAAALVGLVLLFTRRGRR